MSGQGDEQDVDVSRVDPTDAGGLSKRLGSKCIQFLGTFLTKSFKAMIINIIRDHDMLRFCQPGDLLTLSFKIASVADTILDFGLKRL